MSIQMSLVFAITIVEMALIIILLFPLPTKFQQLLLNKYKIYTTTSNFQIVLIFIDALVSVMFVDACKNGLQWGKGDEIIEFSKNTWDEKAKKFYSQRNLYILGALLAFQVCIWFLMMQLSSIIKNKNKLTVLVTAEKKPANAEIEKELKKLELDVSNLKKQYDSAWEQYSKREDSKPVTSEEKKKL